jgi:hypothetical protein
MDRVQRHVETRVGLYVLQKTKSFNTTIPLTTPSKSIGHVTHHLTSPLHFAVRIRRILNKAPSIALQECVIYKLEEMGYPYKLGTSLLSLQLVNISDR